MSYKLKVDYGQSNQALLQCASNKMMISHTLDSNKYLVFDQPLANLWCHQLGWKKNTDDYSISQPTNPN
jgi:hypothetical protein